MDILLISSYVDVTTTSQLTWTSLVVDYNGKFEHSAKCERSGQSTILKLNHYNVSAGYTLKDNSLTSDFVDKYTSLNLSIVKLVVGVPVISPTVALKAAPTLVLAVKATVDAV
jgi:hypothetical protein